MQQLKDVTNVQNRITVCLYKNFHRDEKNANGKHSLRTKLHEKFVIPSEHLDHPQTTERIFSLEMKILFVRLKNIEK